MRLCVFAPIFFELRANHVAERVYDEGDHQQNIVLVWLPTDVRVNDARSKGKGRTTR